MAQLGVHELEPCHVQPCATHAPQPLAASGWHVPYETTNGGGGGRGDGGGDGGGDT